MRYLIIATIAIFISGCLPPDSSPSPPRPDDNKPAQDILGQIFRDCESGYREVFLDVADRLEAGEFEEGKAGEFASNQFVNEQTKKVREAEFMKLNDDIAASHSGETWTIKKAAEYWRKLGKPKQ